MQNRTGIRPRGASGRPGREPSTVVGASATVTGRGPARVCRRRLAAAVASLWLAAAGAAAAAEPGRASGSVAGPDGARLPGAQVLLTRASDGAATSLTTGAFGTWRSPDLAPGAYEVSASLPGFETATRAHVVVPERGEATVDLVLLVASLRETVRVVGVAPRGTLEASEIRGTPAVDIGDALGWKPGLWRLRKGAIANDVVLRGLQSRDLNVLIDGQRVYGACPNHMDPAVFHVDFSEVERVEIGMGPFDVKNQGGLGGTVNVVTRKPQPGWHATPALSAGSFGLVNPSLTLGRGGETLSASGGYSYRRSGVPRDGDGRRFTELANYKPEERDGESFEIGTAWGRALWSPAPGHTLDLAYTRQDAGTVLYPYLLMDAGWDDTDRANLRYEATNLGARQASVRVQGYVTRVDHWMNDERRVSALGKPRAYSMATRADTRTFGGKAEAVAGGLTLGLEAYERRWDATNEMAGSGYAPQAMVPDVAVRVAGAFVEYERRLGTGLDLAAGARLDGAKSEADPARANVAPLRGVPGHARALGRRRPARREAASRVEAGRMGARRRSRPRRARTRGDGALPGAAPRGDGLGRQPGPRAEPQHDPRRLGRADADRVPHRCERLLEPRGRLRDRLRPAAAHAAARRDEHHGPLLRQRGRDAARRRSSTAACRSCSDASSSRATSRTCGATRTRCPSRGIAAGPLARDAPAARPPVGPVRRRALLRRGRRRLRRRPGACRRVLARGEDAGMGRPQRVRGVQAAERCAPRWASRTSSTGSTPTTSRTSATRSAPGCGCRSRAAACT